MSQRILLFAILLLVVINTSCKRYNLSISDRSWNPYHVGEVILLGRDSNLIDTINIISINEYVNPTDPLSAFPSTSQTLIVTAKYPDPDRSKGYIIGSFITITASENGSCIEFGINGSWAHFYGGKYLLSELEEVRRTQLKTTRSLYNDVMIIKSNDSMNNVKGNAIKCFYWSKRHGLLGYDIAEGTELNKVRRIN